ncbi:MAG: hypothetical protein R3C69_09560 [Geminicoccaceae bacterium]
MSRHAGKSRAVLADVRRPASDPDMAVIGDRSGDLIVHATVVRWHGQGILLRGPSGAGKSDFALRLIERGASLVADDLVRIGRRADGRLVARPPGEHGLIELRGQGIFRQPALAETELDLCLDLVAGASLALERLPEPATALYCGQRLPLYHLDPFTASATARLAVLLAGERVA